MKRPKMVARHYGEQLFDVLSLSSLTLRRGDKHARARAGRRGAEVAPNEVKAQVDTGRHAGRGEDVAVVNKESVWQDLNEGVTTLELVGPSPMCRGGASVQQSRRGEGKRAGADRDHSGAT